MQDWSAWPASVGPYRHPAFITAFPAGIGCLLYRNKIKRGELRFRLAIDQVQLPFLESVKAFVPASRDEFEASSSVPPIPDHGLNLERCGAYRSFLSIRRRSEAAQHGRKGLRLTRLSLGNILNHLSGPAFIAKQNRPMIVTTRKSQPFGLTCHQRHIPTFGHSKNFADISAQPQAIQRQSLIDRLVQNHVALLVLRPHIAFGTVQGKSHRMGADLVRLDAAFAHRRRQRHRQLSPIPINAAKSQPAWSISKRPMLHFPFPLFGDGRRWSVVDPIQIIPDLSIGELNGMASPFRPNLRTSRSPQNGTGNHQSEEERQGNTPHRISRYSHNAVPMLIASE